jgi:CheY-like chemotaxis protein
MEGQSATIPPQNSQSTDEADELRPFEPSLRVLVAEDNSLNQFVVCKTLEAWNVQVTLADNGRLAVQAAHQAAFDLILMDVQMPELDGYEASRQLRTHFPDIQALPIVGLTASALPEDRALALAAGMNDILIKPFKPALLYASLAHYTGRPHHSHNLSLPSPKQPVDLASTPVLDWTLLEELAGSNTFFVPQFIRALLQQAPLLLSELAAAAASNDGHALARTAHKLKGQVAYLGVTALSGQLEQLEQACQATSNADYRLVVSALATHWQLLTPQLKARLSA